MVEEGNKWRRRFNRNDEHGMVGVLLWRHSHGTVDEWGGDEDVVDDPTLVLRVVDTRRQGHFYEV